MAVYITADNHFEHPFMAEWRLFGGRDLRFVQEMNEMMRDNWNSRIRKGDEVYVVGDFSFGNLEQTQKWFHSLNGNKHLIEGNHDGNNKVLKLPWKSVSQIKTIKVNKQHIEACHYPMVTWKNAHHGAWHVHGHTHGNLRIVETTTRMDVGVDCSERHGIGRLMPFALEEIAEIMATREYDYVDHHDAGKAAKERKAQRKS